MAYKTRIDMTGVRHGRLVGVAYSHRADGGHAHWLFACDCGAEVVAGGASVRAGNTTSCGCVHREISAARLTVHGHRAGKRHDATYRAWQVMNDGCTNSEGSGWRRCGARGVKVCAAWRADYERFLRDMGERPVNTILSRTDARADFGPGACRWAPVRSRSQRALDAIAERHPEPARTAA